MQAATGARDTDAAEEFWPELLDAIDDARVIPVVGKDLSTARIDGRDVLLYDHVAELLAARLDVDCAAGDPLSVVARRFLARGGDEAKVYSRLNEVMTGLGALSPPPALVQLADIDRFTLFVSTTFDGLLGDAIDRVRFGGQPRARRARYSPKEFDDLSGERASYEHPVVFHLLGRLSRYPGEYAVTEEDMLEWVHALQSGERARPERLMRELNKHHLLLLGSNFTGWLARFFLRVAKGNRLFMAAAGKTDFVVDRLVHEDADLVTFLEDFRTRTRVYRGGVADFLMELHERWRARHPDEGDSARDVPEAVRGAVFLSYASEDLASVRAIDEALRAAGIAVWFDKSEKERRLQAGDDYGARIKRNIELCSVFVPVISRHALASEDRFVRVEWEHALRVRTIPPAKVISPVVVDDTLYGDARAPAELRQLHWEELRNGALSTGFVPQMRELFRDYQRRLDRGE